MISKKNISFLGIILSSIFLCSLYQSKKFTDPFLVPKHYGFMFLGIIGVLGIIFFYFNKKYKLHYKITRIDLSIFLFYFYSVINHLFLGVAPLLDDIKFLNFSMIVLVYFLYKPFFNSVDNVKNKSDKFTYTFFTMVILLSLIQVSFGILQISDVLPNLQNEFKIGGAYGNPGPYANFLTPLFAYAFVLALYHPKSNLKYLAVLSVILVLIILPLTKARTAWITSLVVIGYSLLHHKKFLEMWKKYFSTVWSKIVLFIIVAVFFSAGLFFLTSFKQDSASGRVFIWNVTIDMIKDKPIFGHGFSSFAPVHNDYQANYFERNPNDYENAFLADGVNFAFNEFLQISSETGIIGLLLFIFIFILVFYKKRIHRISGFEDIKKLAAETAILAILVSGLFSYPLQDPATFLLLFISVAIISSNQEKAIYVFYNKKFFRNLMSVIGIIIMFFFIKLLLARFQNEKKWIHAFQNMRQKNYKAADNIYQEIYPVMKYNQFFLFNYGAELTLMGNFEKSVKILKEVEHRLNDADFYIYLGNSYESLGNFKEAEDCFVKATNIMPVKFYPNYRLVLLYQRNGDMESAKKYAQKIMEMPVKVESDLIHNVKNEMKKFLNEQ